MKRAYRSVLVVSIAGTSLLLANMGRADIGVDSAISPEPGLSQVWVATATYSSDPTGDYDNGNGIYAIHAALASYSGPGGFSGSSSYYVAALPTQSAVVVSAYNNCVAGNYTVLGSHQAASGTYGLIPLGTTFDGQWVYSYEC